MNMPRDQGLDHKSSGQLDVSFSPAQTREMETLTSLHPYAGILGLGDLESCLKLEEATFPEHQRCSREKVCIPLSICADYLYLKCMVGSMCLLIAIFSNLARAHCSPSSGTVSRPAVNSAWASSHPPVQARRYEMP